MTRTRPGPQPADPDAALRLIERFAELGHGGRLAASQRARHAARPRRRQPLSLRPAVREHATPLAVAARRARRGAGRQMAAPRSTRSTPAAPRAQHRRRRCARPSGRSRWSRAHGRHRRRLGPRRRSPARCPGWPRPRCAWPSPICCSPPMTPASSPADPADPGAGSGFVVLGMGKLGARELNYSSDIDLVLLYDPAAHPERRTGSAQSSHAWRATGWPYGGARRRRLRVPHRSAAAPRPGRHAARRSPCRPRSPTTRAWARTGSAPP